MNCNPLDPEFEATMALETYMISEILADKDRFKDQEIAVCTFFVDDIDINQPWLSDEGTNSELDASMAIKVDGCSFFAADGTRGARFAYPDPVTPAIVRGSFELATLMLMVG